MGKMIGKDQAHELVVEYLMCMCETLCLIPDAGEENGRMVSDEFQFQIQ